MSGKCVSWFVSGLILFALGYFFSIVSGINMADESWFLQVVHRVTSGEVLYRDVFFGVTPLSVYLTAFFTTLFGTEVLVVKAVVTLCFVLTFILSCLIVQQLGATRGIPFILVISLLIYASPGADCVGSVYAPLANLFFLGCFYAALIWRESEATESEYGKSRYKFTGVLAMAGVAAGLCFASKQNIGLYALVALLLTVINNSWGKRLGGRRALFNIILILSVFALVAFLVLLPVWLSGGIEKFLDYGFINKGTYLRLGGVSYLDGLIRMVIFPGDMGNYQKLQQIHRLTAFLLPALTFGALLVTWLRSGTNTRDATTTVFLFTGASFLGALPRADYSHLTYTVPALLIGLSYAWRRLKPRLAMPWIYPVRAGLVLWLGAGMCYMLLTPYIKIASGNFQSSNLPHFHGALIEVNQRNEILSCTRTLTEEIAKNEQPFLLSPHAGFFYLVTGLKNPTPFDYPLATAFGRNGEPEVIAAISQRKIRTVWLDSRGLSPLTPLRPAVLERYVQEHMDRKTNSGFYMLYIARP